MRPVLWVTSVPQGLLIEVPIDSWSMPSMRLLRLSVQLYNRAEQYELLADALPQLL